MPKADKSGAFANSANRSENESQYEAKGLRGYTILLILISTICIGQTSALIMLIPLKQTVPYLVQFRDKHERVVEMRPLEVSEATARLVVEAELRQYVQVRYEVIPIESVMRERWERADSMMRTHSTSNVYQEFVREATRTFASIRNSSYRRRVRILNVSEQPNNVWHIEFETIDEYAGANTFDERRNQIRRWSSYLQINRLRYQGTPTRKEVLRNPIGIVVVRYTASTISETG